jgi:hypothetical protein
LQEADDLPELVQYYRPPTQAAPGGRQEGCPVAGGPIGRTRGRVPLVALSAAEVINSDVRHVEGTLSYDSLVTKPKTGVKYPKTGVKYPRLCPSHYVSRP